MLLGSALQRVACGHLGVVRGDGVGALGQGTDLTADQVALGVAVQHRQHGVHRLRAAVDEGEGAGDRDPLAADAHGQLRRGDQCVTRGHAAGLGKDGGGLSPGGGYIVLPQQLVAVRTIVDGHIDRLHRGARLVGVGDGSGVQVAALVHRDPHIACAAQRIAGGHLGRIRADGMGAGVQDPGLAVQPGAGGADVIDAEAGGRGVGARRRPHHVGVEVQLVERLGAGDTVHGQLVGALEALHRHLGAAAKGAVRLPGGQVPQLDEPVLQPAHLFAAAAGCQGAQGRRGRCGGQRGGRRRGRNEDGRRGDGRQGCRGCRGQRRAVARCARQQDGHVYQKRSQ